NNTTQGVIAPKSKINKMLGVVGGARTLLNRTHCLLYQATRSKWWKKIKTDVHPSLEERLQELDVTKDDPELYAPVNIGFPTVKTDRKEQLGQRLQHIRVLRENPLIEKKSRIGT
ncbi:hypothetical protein OTU49_011612, partial [Cherax quadricarinatus]